MPSRNMSISRRSREYGLLGLVVAGVAWFAPLPQAAAQSDDLLYSTVYLDQDGESRAYAINNIGQVVGWSDVGGTKHSAVWLNEVFTDLHGTTHLSLNQIFTANYSEGYAISNAGQIVGAARNEIICPEEKWTISNGFILAPAVLTDLGTPYPGDALANLWTFGNPCQDVFDSAATDVSNANHVVGWSDVDGSGQLHAFILQPQNGQWFIQDPAANFPLNTLMISLGTLDSRSTVSAAHGVNDDGWVTGYSYVDSANTSNGEAAFHAFLVVPNGANWFEDVDMDGANDLMIDLGTLGGNNSWGRGINNAGQIVGESTTSDRNTHAFLWEGGVMTDLGTLGGANSSASAINENGDVVGWAENEDGERRAVAWIAGQIVDLNELLLATQIKRLTLSEARDLNQDGEIVGWGVTSGDVTQGFLLKPATDAQRAAHEALLAGAPAGGGGDDDPPSTPSTPGSRTGGSSDLSPVNSTGGGGASNDGGSDVGGQDAGGGGDVQGFGLCAAGVGFAGYLTLIGMFGLRRGLRRR